MAFWNKILSAGVKETVGSIGDTVDKLFTSDEERLKVKAEIETIVTGFATSITKSQEEVLKAELNGNWLQRSWRPVIMLSFGFIVVYEYFFAPVFHLPKAGLPDKFWSLLELGMGGYVIGRSVEKVVDSVSSNLDKIPKRK